MPSRSPFFWVRIAMIAAVLLVVALVSFLFFFESRRKDPEASTTIPVAKIYDTIEQTIKLGSAEDILVRIDQIPPSQAGGDYIEIATRSNDRIRLYTALNERKNELDIDTRDLVTRGLLKSLLDLHIVNLFENVDDQTLRNRLKNTIDETLSSGNNNLAIDAHITSTAATILEVFDSRPASNEVTTAKSAIDKLVGLYPDNEEAIGSLYAILTQFGSGKQHRETSMDLLSHLNAFCNSSTNETIQEIGHEQRGRMLLIEHGVMNVAGRLELYRGDETTQIIENLKSFFEEDYVLKANAANSIALIGQQLEQWNDNQAALKTYQMLSNRVTQSIAIDPDQRLTKLNDALLRGIQRMEAKSKPTQFPDSVTGQNSLVMFLNNSPTSLESAGSLAQFGLLTADVNLQVILVTSVEDPKPLEDYIRTNNLKGLTVVHDPNKSSAYYKFYPALFMPSVLIIGRDGTAIDVNVDIARLSEFLKTLIENG